MREFVVSLINKEKDHPKRDGLFLGGVGETRTLAPVTRPTPLAGAPRHQLEYYSVCRKIGCGEQPIRADLVVKKCGGEEGIRTLGSFESPVFKTGSLNRSDTSPYSQRTLF